MNDVGFWQRDAGDNGLRWVQLRLELLDRAVDDVDIWSCGGKRSVLLEFVEGLLAIILGLVNDRDVEDRRGVFGVFTES